MIGSRRGECCALLRCSVSDHEKQLFDGVQRETVVRLTRQVACRNAPFRTSHCPARFSSRLLGNLLFPYLPGGTGPCSFMSLAVRCASASRLLCRAAASASYLVALSAVSVLSSVATRRANGSAKSSGKRRSADVIAERLTAIKPSQHDNLANNLFTLTGAHAGSSESCRARRMPLRAPHTAEPECMYL